MADVSYERHAGKGLEVVRESVLAYLGKPGDLAALRSRLVELVPATQIANMEAALRGEKGQSYRDGVLIQLSCKLADPHVDATKRPEGGRSLAQKLAAFFEEQHIPAVKDAYQNIAKNSPELCRGNFPKWDGFLRWVNEASTEQLKACLEYACAWAASQARPVPPMPELDPTKLTFARVMSAYLALLAEGSQGTFEQYIIAGLMNAQLGQNPQYRVETRNINASDASSDAAGDVEVLTGNRILEAIEVTAGDWQGKLGSASRKIRGHDLGRIHILAPLPRGYEEVVAALSNEQQDVSVIDLRSTIAVLLAALPKPARKVALHRTYECLDRYAVNEQYVVRFVNVLADQGLVLVASQQ